MGSPYEEGSNPLTYVYILRIGCSSENTSTKDITHMKKDYSLYRHTFWLSLSVLGLLLFLTACGSNNTSTASPSTTTVVNTPTTTSGGGAYGTGGGKYGNGSGSTATAAPTTVATGPKQTVMIATVNGSFAFSPATLTVPVGTVVVWTNSTGAPHTVTSDDGKTFDSGISTLINPGASFSFTFTTAGTYSYHCQVHPSMKATIIVK